MRIILTEEEWNQLCDRSFDEATDEYRCTALPVCCGNVSALRDVIIALRKNGEELTVELRAELLHNFQLVKDCHDSTEWDWTVLNKIMDQVKEEV